MKIVIPYSPRVWQSEQHKKLDRFTVMVIHRRAGKTIFAVNEMIKRALTCPLKKPQVAYICPTFKQAKRVAWEIFKEYASALPLTEVNESELRIDLPNGGRIMLLGAENPDSLRGIYLDYVVLDEVADMPEMLWSTIISICLVDRKGGALFIGTPKGKNYFHDLYMKGMSGEPGWRSVLLKWNDTNVLPPEEVERERREKAEEVFSQEFECSFTAAIKGAYFGKHMERAENEKRICSVPWDEDLPVSVSWDIGLDGTSLWYSQIANGEVRIIKFEHYEDKDVPQVLNFVMNKSYRYEIQYLPHDARKRFSTNKNLTVVGIIQNSGLKVKVLDRLDKLDSITLGRNLINKAIFNYRDTDKGCESLRQYRAEIDETTGVQRVTEVHDKHSHPASAWCTLAQGLRVSNGSLNENSVSSYLKSKGSNRTKVKSDWKVFK